MGRDWLSTRPADAGVTFMSEFAPYAMQALPLKTHTRQRFTEFDNTPVHIWLAHFSPTQYVCIVIFLIIVQISVTLCQWIKLTRLPLISTFVGWYPFCPPPPHDGFCRPSSLSSISGASKNARRRLVLMYPLIWQVITWGRMVNGNANWLKMLRAANVMSGVNALPVSTGYVLYACKDGIKKKSMTFAIQFNSIQFIY